jgi:mycothiol synthase
LRHIVATSKTVVFLVARVEDKPAGCGFVDSWPEEHARAHCLVIPSFRRRGIGSVFLEEIGRLAVEAGRSRLLGDVIENDGESRAYLKRRGFEIVGAERAVVLELADHVAVAPEPPPAVDIVALADRPDLAEALYDVGLEAADDVPGSEGTVSYEQWRTRELDRPTRRRDLFFVALAAGEPVGYASIDDLGGEGRNGLTAIRRAWRRRGVATALKRAQIMAAQSVGMQRLITTSEERNVPMSALNAKLGYRPDSSRSTLTMRGRAVLSRRRG